MENNSNSPQTMVLIPQSEYLQQTQLLTDIKFKLDKIDLSQAVTQKEYLSKKETCDRFSIAASYFEKLKRLGKIKTYKVTGKIFVKTEEVQQLFKESKQ